MHVVHPTGAAMAAGARKPAEAYCDRRAGGGASARGREPSPCPADDMICWPVSVRVDNVKNK